MKVVKIVKQIPFGAIPKTRGLCRFGHVQGLLGKQVHGGRRVRCVRWVINSPMAQRFMTFGEDLKLSICTAFGSLRRNNMDWKIGQKKTPCIKQTFLNCWKRMQVCGKAMSSLMSCHNSCRHCCNCKWWDHFGRRHCRVKTVNFGDRKGCTVWQIGRHETFGKGVHNSNTG